MVILITGNGHVTRQISQCSVYMQTLMVRQQNGAAEAEPQALSSGRQVRCHIAPQAVLALSD